MSAQPDQRTPEWHEGRKGRVTASRVGAILGLSKHRTRDDVLAEMVAAAQGLPPAFTGNEATEYGQTHEADALAEYEMLAGTMVEPCGLIVHPAYDWIAASPDGLVGDVGMVECKCPYRARYISPSEEYVAQMQLQIAVTKRDWCDFAIWRKGESLVVVRVERESSWLTRNLPTLETFIDEYRAKLQEIAA